MEAIDKARVRRGNKIRKRKRLERDLEQVRSEIEEENKKVGELGGSDFKD